jgi:hypothetical protein
MAARAARCRAVVLESRTRVTMTPQAEVVEAGFGTQAELGAAASMATKASTVPGSIDEIVVALDAVHLAMPVVRKVDLQGCRTSHDRLTQDENRASAQHRNRGETRGNDENKNLARVTREHHAAEKTWRIGGWIRVGSCPQECEQRRAR